MIEVQDLVKQYGELKAVDHLSFKVEKGQIYGFLGPNGAGKSTTMNIITGYITPSEGTVLIDGYDICLEPEKAKTLIGYLPEVPPVYPDMTTYEFLSFAGELKRLKKKECLAEIDRVMAMTGITDMRKRLIKNLSKGYRQRVGFACALLGNPEILIFDEPTVGLDPKQIIEMRKLIKSLGKEHTVILSSHILSEVSAICDHILIISKGKLVASDTSDRLIKLMQRSDFYEMQIQGDPQLIKKLLGKLEILKSFEIKSYNSGVTSVCLEADTKTDPRADVFRLLAKADCPILELTSKTGSLEDVFLELTEQDEQKDILQSEKGEPEDAGDL